MTLVTIDLGDVTGGHDPDDHVVIRAEAFRESQGGGITSTAEVVIPLVDGVGQAEVEPGPVVVAFRCRAVADTREKRGVVPDEGPVGIEEIIGGAFEYTPSVVNRGLDQIEGARENALAQVDAAVDAAILGTGGDTVRQMVGQRKIASYPSTEWAHSTPTGHRLPLGYTADGRLDAHARTIWGEDISGLYRSADDGSGVVHAMTTPQGQVLLSIRRDGVVDIPGLRMPPGTVGAFAVREKYRTTDGGFANVLADPTQITGWGSSSIDGMAPELSSQLQKVGVSYTARSKRGERAEHISARMGARPAVFEPREIPSSGSVGLRGVNITASANMLPFTGTLGGIHGSLSGSADAITFTRTTPGDPVTLTENTSFIPDLPHEVRGHTTILSVGKNNIYDDDAVNTVISITDQMVDYLTPLYPRVLVMGHFGNTNWGSSSPWASLTAINEYLADKYGELFIDHAGALASPEIWDRTGITPTADDLTAQAEHRLPPSLSSDHQHMNNAADTAIADICFERMQYLGWY